MTVMDEFSEEEVTPAVQRGLDFLYPRPYGGAHEGWEVGNVRAVLRAAILEDREALAEAMHGAECPDFPLVSKCLCDMSWYRSHVDIVIRAVLGGSK